MYGDGRRSLDQVIFPACGHRTEQGSSTRDFAGALASKQTFVDAHVAAQRERAAADELDDQDIYWADAAPVQPDLELRRELARITLDQTLQELGERVDAEAP